MKSRKKKRKLLFKKKRTNSYKRITRKKVTKNGRNRTILLKKAFSTGQEIAEKNPSIIESTDPKRILNLHWNQWRTAMRKGIWPWKLYYGIAKQFVKGFEVKSGLSEQNWILTPTNKKVAAIVTVMNEEKTISSVLNQLKRLPLHELIVVVNGTTDNSFYKIREESSAIIIEYPEPLGHDVGRSIGAKISQSDILLFLDGDFPIFAEHLIPFIYAVDNGTDVALNNISPYIHYFNQRDSVTIIKEFLNRSLGRGDLRANSLTAIPHALSKRAVELIGYNILSVPPKAQAKAIDLGLIVDSTISVNVISKNKQRNNNTGINSSVADMIIGDHLEALKTMMEVKGARLFYEDQIRNRRMTGGDAK